MDGRRAGGTALAVLALSACATPAQRTCHQFFSYELRDDGTFVYRGIVQISPGTFAEPYAEYPLSHPEHDSIVTATASRFPDFLATRKASGSREVPCRKEG